MKIIKLTAENIKKLRAIEITPHGEIVTISGKNGAGKTSVLDSIWWALAGTSHIQAQPIRKGETKARIRLDLGEIVVERKFTANGSTLNVESAEGSRFSSPQKMLDALIGELSFDPLAFSRLQPGKQFDELRQIVKLEIDINALDGQNRADYQKRTDVNREAKAKRAQAEAITLPSIPPNEQIDEHDLLNQLTEAGAKNTAIEKERAKRSDTIRDIANQREEAGRLRARADALEAEAEKAQELLIEMPPIPALVDVSKLRALLDSAKQSNAIIERKNRRDELLSEMKALELLAENLTEQMEARESVKREAIMAAEFPVKGLGFGEGIVTYKGVPFEQASSSEQLRVSLAIAMAANPKVRVIRIQDGSLLDADALAEIATMAKDNDYQVWIERVDMGDAVGVIIEDGVVVAEKEEA